MIDRKIENRAEACQPISRTEKRRSLRWKDKFKYAVPAAVALLSTLFPMSLDANSAKVNAQNTEPGFNTGEVWANFGNAPTNRWFKFQNQTGEYGNAGVELLIPPGQNVRFWARDHEVGIYRMQFPPGVSEGTIYLKTNPAYNNDFREGNPNNQIATYIMNAGTEALVQQLGPDGRELGCEYSGVQGVRTVQKLVNAAGDMGNRWPEHATYTGYRIVRGKSDVEFGRDAVISVGALPIEARDKVALLDAINCLPHLSQMPEIPAPIGFANPDLIGYLNLHRLNPGEANARPGVLHWLKTHAGENWNKGVALASNPDPRVDRYDTGVVGKLEAVAKVGANSFNLLNMVTYPDEVWHLRGLDSNNRPVIWIDGAKGDIYQLRDKDGRDISCVWGNQPGVRLARHISEKGYFAFVLSEEHKHFILTVFRSPYFVTTYKMGFGPAKPSDFNEHPIFGVDQCIPVLPQK